MLRREFSSGATTRPVTLLTSVVSEGGDVSTLLKSASSVSRVGSTRGLWNAWLVWIGLTRTSSASKRPETVLTASAEPLNTWCAPFLAAIASLSLPADSVVLAHRRINYREGSEHRRHRPGFGNRRQYFAPPHDGPHPVLPARTPPPHAPPPNSPTLCPTTASGRTPQGSPKAP